MIRAGACLLALLGMIAALGTPLPLGAQTNWQPLQPSPSRQAGPELASGTTAVIRALDKVSGDVVDLDLAVGASVDFARLRVSLTACRYPAENPASDAYAFLEILDAPRNELLFRGWMIASSPALNALDHPRYDIWVIRCR
ncbi:MAG: DUF2155 domain-containing protein [Rhodobacteraceae bacterium]|nr:DUF2155 domain-containing protein [Paracoccaceae bacterium]